MADSTAFEPVVRNAWYPAAWPEELADGFVGRTLLNEPLIIFRGPDGKVAALEDRCCHRGAPLTHGALVPQGIQCGYHGLTFDGSGACVEVPGQKNVPQKAMVKSFPVVERQQFIWVWMGDPDLADESTIIDYPYNDQPGQWPHRKGIIPIKCNYMLLIDNLMDLTHLGYVHTKTIGGNPKTHVEAEIENFPTNLGVRFIRWMRDCQPPPTYVKGAGFNGRVDRWQELEYVAPSSVLQWSGALDVGKGAEQNREQPGFHLRVYHGAVPETDNTCFYFFTAAHGYRQDDPQATQEMYDEVYPTFLEDARILEAQQRSLDREPSRPLVGIRADGALTHARRAIHRMIEHDGAQA